MTHWWSLRGPERQAAKRADEARKGRRRLRRYYEREGDIGYFIGMDGERFAFTLGDKQQRRSARNLARETFDNILRQ
jgi:hypothetical protein